MKFDYARYRQQRNPDVLRPIIPLIITNSFAPLEHPFHSVATEALVDSGSDYCIFPSQLGELIGTRADDVRRAEEHFRAMRGG